MSSRAVGRKKRALDRRVAIDLPESRQNRWLERFADLYHELLDAARNNERASKSQRSYIVPLSWRIKLAMMRHLLTVHRYKPRGENLLLPDFELDAGGRSGSKANCSRG